MDAQEIAEAISEGINRLVALIDSDADDEYARGDIERLLDALECAEGVDDDHIEFQAS